MLRFPFDFLKMKRSSAWLGSSDKKEEGRRNARSQDVVCLFFSLLNQKLPTTAAANLPKPTNSTLSLLKKKNK